MDRARAVAFSKLGMALAFLAFLLALWRLDPGPGFGAVALVAAVILGGPIALLVAIDTGRVVRRASLGPAARAFSWLPQVLLGSVACASGLGLGLLMILGLLRPLWLNVPAGLMAIGLLGYGTSLLREASPRSKSPTRSEE